MAGIKSKVLRILESNAIMGHKIHREHKKIELPIISVFEFLAGIKS